MRLLPVQSMSRWENSKEILRMYRYLRRRLTPCQKVQVAVRKSDESVLLRISTQTKRTAFMLRRKFGPCGYTKCIMAENPRGLIRTRVWCSYETKLFNLTTSIEPDREATILKSTKKNSDLEFIEADTANLERSVWNIPDACMGDSQDAYSKKLSFWKTSRRGLRLCVEHLRTRNKSKKMLMWLTHP